LEGLWAKKIGVFSLFRGFAGASPPAEPPEHRRNRELFNHGPRGPHGQGLRGIFTTKYTKEHKGKRKRGKNHMDYTNKS
jgi:hypothetical protein